MFEFQFLLEFTPLEFETAEKLGFVWADIVVGSRRSLYSAFDELNELFKQTNLKKLLEDHGYSLRNGRKYIFAIKQFKLDLF